ncbi:hypothetical protein FRB99_005409 [Tulasnella sp. 403]|nr:hypothetical protein FRB99_005409 [Tulasnella sp. 403]
MSSLSTHKRVRFSPDVKAADDIDVRPPLPSTPRRVPTWSPPLSDTSLSDVETFVHTVLLPRAAHQRHLNAIWDVRFDASQAYTLAANVLIPMSQHFEMLATQPMMRRIQLISRHFAWTIVVENPNGVRLVDVLYRIHSSLRKTVAKNEFDVVPPISQSEILRAYQRNYSTSQLGRTREDGLKRVDFLGKRTLFAGIQKDDSYINSRVRDHATRSETFVLEFATAA